MNDCGCADIVILGANVTTVDAHRPRAQAVAIKFDRSIADEELKLIEEKLTNAVIRQQTPLRVLHRRVDRIREKHIYKARIKRLAPDSVEMRIRCQGGLYIKELITGDEGRTKPCVAEIINARAEPLELDVLGIVKRR